MSKWISVPVLALASVTLADPPADLGARIDAVLQSYAGQGQFQGSVLVARKGRVVYRGAFGKADVERGIDNTPETRQRIGSLGKVFTAAIILQLVDEGRLDLDAASRIRSRPQAALAAIIEQKTGKPFGVVLRERILEPLGLHDTGLVVEDGGSRDLASTYNRTSWGEVEPMPPRDGVGGADDTGMYSTVDDLYRWNRAIDDGVALSETGRARMFAGGQGEAGFGCRLGSYTAADDTERRLAWSAGGVPATTSMTVRLLDDGDLIVLLGNAQPLPLRQIALGIVNTLAGVPVTPPAPPLRPLYDVLLEQGVDAAVKQFAGTPELPPELAINRLGYELMNRGRLDDAIHVFQFNVAAYPQAWNTYDSLAEAYMNAGDYLTATRFYNRSLALNPGNSNARMMLDRLESKPGPF